jgi:LexA-binding, inner membrane-associated putative hydrolase
MSPETHLFASWIIAAKTTRNLRDSRLVTLAGILPDADGLGLIVDMFTNWRGGWQSSLYAQYHHFLLHGAFGAIVIAGTLAFFARDRWRVLLLALLTFHVHLLCDLLGSRGPSVQELWPIYYFGPFTRHHEWLWAGQWRLDGWQNRYLSAALMLWSLWIAAKRGDSFVGVFNRRVDAVFSGVLKKWRQALLARFASARGTGNTE